MQVGYINRAFLSFGLLGGCSGQNRTNTKITKKKKLNSPDFNIFKMLGDDNNQEMFNTQQNDLDQRYNSTAMKLTDHYFFF